MKRYLLALVFFLSAVICPIQAANTDRWNVGGDGTYFSKDMVHIDSNYNLRLYNGSLVLGDNNLTPSTNITQTTPSTSVGGYYGIKVPFFNGGPATANGTVIIASATVTTTGYGSSASILSTTTILGIADGVYATGAVGYMTIAGYALVLTTGTVTPGDMLVTTNTAVGYAGRNNSTPASGSVIAKALSFGTVTGGLTLAIVSQQ